MTTLCRTLFLALFVGLMILGESVKGQSENPWGGSVPSQTTNLAYERYPVEGFAWPTSIRPGQQITFYVSVMDLVPQSSEGQTYEVHIFRSPDFDHEVASLPPTEGHFYPLRAADGDSIFPGVPTTKRPIDYNIGCRAYWSPTARTYTQTSSWTSGLYFARLIHLSANVESLYYYIPFIVRATSPGSTSKILFKYDWTTLQAYNYWGGGSLYSMDQDAATLTPDSIIALDRPLRRDYSRWISYVAPFERVLQDSGYSMEYCNNIDIDSLGVDFLGHYQCLVLWTHDEYWSKGERDAIEAFKGNELPENLPRYHGNIARFTSNSCYWLVRWIGTGSKYTKLQCRKDNYPGPVRPRYDLWRLADATTGRAALPEAKFLGSQYETGWNDINSDPATEQPPAILTNPSHWIFRNTGLESSEQFGKGIMKKNRQRGLVSGEVDNLITGSADFPTLEVLAQRWVYSRADSGGIQRYRDILHQMVYYEDTSSNARVFAQGAQGGGWVYSILNEPGTIDPADVVRMKTITINIISHFSGKKYIGKVWSSGPENAFRWENNIELDGNVQIPQGKYLKAISNTITVDSTFAINGTLEINGNVTITGTGQINVGATGEIKLMPGATLTLRTKLYAASNVTLTVLANTTLCIEQPAQLLFGSNSGLTVYGKLIAQGTESQPVLFSTATSSPAPNSWNYIALYGGPDTLEYCTIEYGTHGVYINNANINLIRNCVIRNNGWNGILGMNTTSNYGGLIVQDCLLSGNGRAIGLGNATADILHTRLELNNWQGLYQANAYSFLTNSQIERNGYAGFHTAGASIAILSDRNGSPGYNSIRHNSEVSGQNVGEVSVGGGYAYVGYTDGEFTLWGCNTIDRGGSASDYLIDNFTDNLVYAHQTYWGEKDPSDEDFLGPVDYAYWLSAPCLPSGPSVASGKSIGAAGAGMTSGFGDTVHLIEVAHRFAAQMRQYPDSAFQYLPLLLRLVGPSGVISEAHVGGWENFLRSLRTLSWRSSLHEVCNGLILQRKLHSRFYDDAITFADSILRGNPSERLWLVCQATKMSAYLALLDTVEAGRVLYSARGKGNRIDSSLIAFYAELLQLETAARPNREAISSGALKASQAPALQLTPASFVLEQNYPNPFNPSTRISFALPQDAHVTLKLYDILGREVMTLLNESRSAGYHHAMLDGSKLASGVYLYRMDAGQYSSTKRLLLLK